MKNEKGFTLIELLIVIGIIAILASAVIVAINPGQQFAQARNATRRSHLSTVASAIHSWAAMENQGIYPDCIEDAAEGVDMHDDTLTCGEENYDLETLLEDYINALPTPPTDDDVYMVRIDGGTLELWVDGVEDEWPGDDEVIVQ